MHTAFLTAATWRIISTISLLLTSFYSLWLYTSYIRPERYGVIALALTIMAYLPYFDGGFRTVLNRAILASTDAGVRAGLLRFGQKLYTYLFLGIVVGNLLFMAIYGLMPGARAENLSLGFFLLFALANALTSSANIQWGVFVAAQQQSKLYILQTLSAWAAVNALAWAFSAGWELWSIPFGSAVGFAVSYPLSIRWIKLTFPGIKIFDVTTGAEFREQFRRFRNEAWFCFRAQITTIVLYSADILIIGYFCPKAEVAVYYVIIRLIGMTRSLLQTGGEVGWPFLAQRGGASREDSIPWFGFHGWIYGSVGGALAVVSIPFCSWYMGEAWTVSPELLWVVVLRFIVVGLGSSATYLLYALGEFRPISKCLEVELVAGLILGTVGGYMAGSLGVATGFLLATGGGTLIPVYVAYARRGGTSFWHVFGTIWSRAVLGFAGSYITATLLMKTIVHGVYIPFIASIAVAVSFLLAFALAMSRQRFPLHFDARQFRQLIRKI